MSDAFDVYDLELERRDRTGVFARPRSARRLALTTFGWALVGLAGEVGGLAAPLGGFWAGLPLAAGGPDGFVLAPVSGLLVGVLVAIPLLAVGLISLLVVPGSAIATCRAARRESGGLRRWPVVLALLSLSGFLLANAWLGTLVLRTG